MTAVRHTTYGWLEEVFGNAAKAPEQELEEAMVSRT
jgi:hypothetical protein